MKPYIFIMGIILSMGLHHASEAEEVVRLSNVEWPPYFSAALEHDGIGSRIIAEAFALEGIRVEYTYLPAKRALFMAQEGNFDGAVSWQMNAEREPYFYASETLWEVPWVFFHLTSYSFDWTTFDDLKHVRIGGTLEYMYSEEFLRAEQMKKILVDRVPSDDLNLKKLQAGRIDIFPQVLDIGYYQLRELFDADTVNLFTHHPRPLSTHKDQLLLSKKNPRSQALLDIFNRGFRKLQESGKYDAYFEAFRKGDYGKKQK